MTSKQIKKYEFNLSLRFLWWSIWNKEKMLANDYKIASSRVIDIVSAFLLTLLTARITRKLLFNQ